MKPVEEKSAPVSGNQGEALRRFMSDAAKSATGLTQHRDQRNALRRIESAVKLANRASADWNLEQAADYAQDQMAKLRGTHAVLECLASTRLVLAAFLPFFLGNCLGWVGCILGP